MKKKIGICQGPRCRSYGGAYLLAALKEKGIEAKRLDCQSLCTYSPVARIAGLAKLRTCLQDILDAHTI